MMILFNTAASESASFFETVGFFDRKVLCVDIVFFRFPKSLLILLGIDHSFLSNAEGKGDSKVL